MVLDFGDYLFVLDFYYLFELSVYVVQVIFHPSCPHQCLPLDLLHRPLVNPFANLLNLILTNRNSIIHIIHLHINQNIVVQLIVNLRRERYLQFPNYSNKMAVFLLHFLVMATALVWSTSFEEF